MKYDRNDKDIEEFASDLELFTRVAAKICIISIGLLGLAHVITLITN